jgi:putative transcriptional regulator
LQVYEFGGEYMNRTLKALRKLNNMTQSEVAELLGINMHTYFNKETGKAPFTIDEAKKLSDLFEVSIDEIFFNNGVIKLRTNTA